MSIPTIIPAPITDEGREVTAMITSLGWTQATDVLTYRHREGGPRYENHPFVFHKGNFTLSLVDAANGNIHDAVLVLGDDDSDGVPAPRVLAYQGRSDGASLESLVGYHPVIDMIETMARRPEEVTWLAVEAAGH